MFRVLDLFAGAGGMSLGFLQTEKYEIAAAIEKNPDAKKTYQRNHAGVIMFEDILDITDYDAFEKVIGKVDIVVGGPPCQGFSNANRQKNSIINQNNSLVKKYVEVIENLKPMAFVMENVRMIQSETHRFYRSEIDMTEVDRLGVILRKETLGLHYGICPINDIGDYLLNPDVIPRLLLPEKSFQILRLLLKKSYKEENRDKILEKKGKSCLNAIHALQLERNGVSEEYRQYESYSLDTFKEYCQGKLSFEEAEPQMAAYINVQHMLLSAKELLENRIIIDHILIDSNGVFVEVQSYAVIEYIKKKLGRFYSIDSDVLNAASFGAPQLRERFIALGIRLDIVESNNIKPKLPDPEYQPKEYRTVRDAIMDLEIIQPIFNVYEEALDFCGEFEASSPLIFELRNSKKLFNHVITSTREKALKRFSTLQQGENFHNLDQSLIEDTYSQPKRTQNSIYMRLNYQNPCGTVTNVRKAMWIHPTIDRAISIREAARLQTFPDSFVFEGRKDSQYQQIGNAVPPLLAKAIANNLALSLEGFIHNPLEMIND